MLSGKEEVFKGISNSIEEYIEYNSREVEFLKQKESEDSINVYGDVNIEDTNSNAFEIFKGKACIFNLTEMDKNIGKDSFLQIAVTLSQYTSLGNKGYKVKTGSIVKIPLEGTYHKVEKFRYGLVSSAIVYYIGFLIDMSSEFSTT